MSDGPSLLGNLAARGVNCPRVGDALRGPYGLDDGAVAFFTLFLEPPPDSGQRLLAGLDARLGGGDSIVPARPAVRLLQAYEPLFWNTLAEGIE
jgi:hypothetical protein